MAEYFYTLDLGSEFGPRLQKLAAQQGGDADVEAYAAMLLCAAIEIAEISDEMEAEMALRQIIKGGEQSLQRLRGDRDEAEDGIPF